jgi:hypothetical protein
MTSGNKDTAKKWFFICFYSDGRSVFTGTDHLVQFCTEDQILTFDPNINKPDIMQRLGIIYEDLKEFSDGPVTEELLLKGIKDALHVEELAGNGEKIRREDLVEAIYTKELVRQFFAEKKL